MYGFETLVEPVARRTAIRLPVGDVTEIGLHLIVLVPQNLMSFKLWLLR